MADIFDILRFEVDKTSDLTMTDTYQEIGNVEMLDAELGTYEYGFSVTHSFDSTTTSEMFRMSLDDGATWDEYIIEPKDKTDEIFDSYNFFKVGMSGDLSLILEARQETSAGVMVVQFADVFIRRVK